MSVKGVVGYRCWRLDPEEELLLPSVNALAPAWERKGATEAICVPLARGSWNPFGGSPRSRSGTRATVSFRYVVNNATNYDPYAPGNVLASPWSLPEPAPEPYSEHVVAGTDCECGLYAYCDIPNFWVIPPNEPYVFGAVLTWGKATSHGTNSGLEGFRSRFAIPIALLQLEDRQYQQLLQRIASRVGASLVSTQEQLKMRTRDWTHMPEAAGWKPPELIDDDLRRFLRY